MALLRAEQAGVPTDSPMASAGSSSATSTTTGTCTDPQGASGVTEVSTTSTSRECRTGSRSTPSVAHEPTDTAR